MNGDVVKLKVDLHGEKKPPRFPFPGEPTQRRHAWCSFFIVQWNKRAKKIRLFFFFEHTTTEVIEEVVTSVWLPNVQSV